MYITNINKYKILIKFNYNIIKLTKIKKKKLNRSET